jgi:hypothetical protein
MRPNCARRQSLEARKGSPFTDEAWLEAKTNLVKFFSILAEWQSKPTSEPPILRRHQPRHPSVARERRSATNNASRRTAFRPNPDPSEHFFEHLKS